MKKVNFSKINQRRIDLIKKEFLTDLEKIELKELQTFAESCLLIIQNLLFQILGNDSLPMNSNTLKFPLKYVYDY